MSSEILTRLENRAKEADGVIAWLKIQVASLQSTAQSAELQRLQEENAQLRTDVEHWTALLCQAELNNGLKQVPLPGKGISVNSPAAPVESTNQASEAKPISAAAPNVEKKAEKKTKATKKPAAKSDAKPATAESDDAVDIGLLDLRVGCIVSAEKHPDADSLYVEQVDVGEPAPRTVVSGLVRFVPLDQMQGRMAVLLCNLKPAKMRGVTSQAMVMCASSPDAVEILEPPPNAVSGDAVTCPGFVSRCGAQLNPKKKIFEQVAPELKTDGERRATYRGVAWEVAGKGGVTAKTLANVQIK